MSASELHERELERHHRPLRRLRRGDPRRAKAGVFSPLDSSGVVPETAVSPLPDAASVRPPPGLTRGLPEAALAPVQTLTRRQLPTSCPPVAHQFRKRLTALILAIAYIND